MGLILQSSDRGRYRADSSKQYTHTFTTSKSYLAPRLSGTPTHPKSVGEPDNKLEHSIFINSSCNATLQIHDNRNIWDILISRELLFFLDVFSYCCLDVFLSCSLIVLFSFSLLLLFCNLLWIDIFWLSDVLTCYCIVAMLIAKLSLQLPLAE